MWLVRRLRISTKCRRYLPTILVVLFLASLSTLLLGIPDIPHRAIHDPRSGQRLSQDRIEPPLPVLNQEINNRPSRDQISDWDKFGNRDLGNRIPHQFGRGLLDRWKASNGEESESQFRSTGNSNRKFGNLQNNQRNDAKEQYGTGQVTAHKNSQKFPKSSSNFFQPANHIVSNNAQKTGPNNAVNSGQPNVQNVGYQAPKQNQDEFGQHVRTQPENLAKPLPLNPVLQGHQEAPKQSPIQSATSKQNKPQVLHRQYRPSELGVRSQIVPNKSPSSNAARTNIASEENRLHQLSNQQPFHPPQRINQNGVPNQQQLTSNPPSAMKVIANDNVPRIQQPISFQQDHDLKYKTSMKDVNSIQHQQKLGYQQQQVVHQQNVRIQQQNQQQVQMNQQQQQQQQVLQQQEQYQQQQQQQHHHRSQQQKQQQQQQQQQQLLNQQQQQQLQQQLQQRQNQEPLVGNPSASKSINREMDSSKPLLPSEQTRRDIVWTEEVEEAIPEAFLWEDVDEWTKKVRAQPVTFMATGTETKCGRPPNQYLEMGNGIKLCARYKDLNYIEIEGELFSYYLARMLDIRTVPPLVLSTIQRQGAQWSSQQAKLTEAHWDDGEIITFTQFLEGFERARIPKTLIKDKNSAPLEISSPELQSLTLSDRVYLAQWSDLIVFDYLIGHIDRVTNHQEGSSHHDVTIQNSIWAHQPIHNLAISKQTSVLWFFDNETGFRMGYRTLYHNRVDGQKYTEFHNSMLHSMCVFRSRTVEKIIELHNHPNPFESLMSFVRNHEPIAQNLHVNIPGAPNDLPEIFKDRLGNVFHWIEQCRQRLG